MIICRFVRSGDDNDESVWEKRLAKKYYDKLFKEYCIADMSRCAPIVVLMLAHEWRRLEELLIGGGV